ncbi:hypothetical protein ACFXDI_49515 [Streptomyces mirabilis]|uniref:hypothetical protein n=1 Tax=Streptomyces mirabilis TaxID=68239 RepID=UPI0036A9D1A8
MPLRFELAALRGSLRAQKGTLTFDTIARWASAHGRPVSAGALRRALDGQLPTRNTALALAFTCGADEETAGALLAALRRILAGPRPPAMYSCDLADRADERRQQDEAARPWLTVQELDPHDQQLRNTEDPARRSMTVWVEDLTDDERQELQ